jgi:hypothetical protein
MNATLARNFGYGDCTFDVDSCERLSSQNSTVVLVLDMSPTLESRNGLARDSKEFVFAPETM